MAATGLSGSTAGGSTAPDRFADDGNGLPIRLLHDRVLVRVSGEDGGDRRSTGGIVIPATAQLGRRLSWAEVVGVGQHVRSVETGERVLFDPEGKAEIELHGVAYTLLRERDLHAVASPRVDTGSTGLYL